MKGLSLARQFMLVSFIILVSGMLIIGWWVGRQIKAGVISRTAATTALYVDSFVAPYLQELGYSGSILPEHVMGLSRLLQDTPLGQKLVAFKVWDAKGQILFSTEPSIIGQLFPVGPSLASAWRGEVVSQISSLKGEENARERERWSRLLETYSPVRLEGDNRIVAVAEFYQTVDELEKTILAAQTRSWLMVGGATLAMYLLLAGMVQRGSNTIVQQQAELKDKVSLLTELLKQNEELHKRVRRAATRTTALNERFLRRISAELHDGPGQDLGLLLLRLDSIKARCAACPLPTPDGRPIIEDLDTMETSLRHALQEVRSISAGLRLPEMDRLTLSETLAKVVRAHMQRTGTSVAINSDTLPQDAPLPVKITLYRLVQEALYNAYRHGGGEGQEVRVQHDAGHLIVQVSDHGPGFDWATVAGREDHLGLAGMRERVESLGGVFQLNTQLRQGTQVIARIPLRSVEEDNDG